MGDGVQCVLSLRPSTANKQQQKSFVNNNNGILFSATS